MSACGTKLTSSSLKSRSAVSCSFGAFAPPNSLIHSFESSACHDQLPKQPQLNHLAPSDCSFKPVNSSSAAPATRVGVRGT
jgi:hypothetical protein